MTRTQKVTLAALALLCLPGAAAGQDAEPLRARTPGCKGIYTGSARGIFWCRVVVVHDARTNRTSLQVETEEDIQMTGDALAVKPGGFEWKGPPATGLLRSGDGSVTSAWSWLQTGQPPNQVDYAAARAAPAYQFEQGQLALDLYSATPGPAGEGGATHQVHGAFTARLLPAPGSKGAGEVRITVTF